MEHCVFCAIVAGDLPAAVIHETDDTVAFLDVAPLTTGHTLVVPRHHVTDLWEADAGLMGRLTEVAHTVAVRLRATLQPAGVNLLHATGAVAFQTVFHLHLHVVPRYEGDGVRFPFERTLAERADLDELAARIVDVG